MKKMSVEIEVPERLLHVAAIAYVAVCLREGSTITEEGEDNVASNVAITANFSWLEDLQPREQRAVIECVRGALNKASAKTELQIQ